MSEILANKWRPQTFSDYVGHEHYLKAFTNSVDSKKSHSAYLITGSRGIGKTTLGRLMAKSWFCSQSLVCNNCSNCNDIKNNIHPDLIEIDGAATTKVENIRELLHNCSLLPGRGEYKVYLIDEVHMLSQHSFNALLKVLEEPPKHCKFILVTTEEQKIPQTILSRCINFKLNNFDIKTISKRLEYILKKESIEYEVKAIELIANIADGSLRDALTKLNFIISLSPNKIKYEETSKYLSIPSSKVIDNFFDAMQNYDIKGMLNIIQESCCDDNNVSTNIFLNHLLNKIHDTLIFQNKNNFSNTINNIECLNNFYEIIVYTKKHLEFSTSSKQALDMMSFRLAYLKSEPSISIQNSSIDTGPVNIDSPLEVTLKKKQDNQQTEEIAINSNKQIIEATIKSEEPENKKENYLDNNIFSKFYEKWRSMLDNLDSESSLTRHIAFNICPKLQKTSILLEYTNSIESFLDKNRKDNFIKMIKAATKTELPIIFAEKYTKNIKTYSAEKADNEKKRNNATLTQIKTNEKICKFIKEFNGTVVNYFRI